MQQRGLIHSKGTLSAYGRFGIVSNSLPNLVHKLISQLIFQSRVSEKLGEKPVCPLYKFLELNILQCKNVPKQKQVRKFSYGYRQIRCDAPHVFEGIRSG